MIKRLTWFVGGAIAGIAGASVAKRKAKEVAAEYAPAQMARKAGDRVREAVAEGKRAMKTKEAELRAVSTDGTLRRPRRGRHGDRRWPPVEPGQVIVLRQVCDGVPRGRRRRPDAAILNPADNLA
jgi:hypothetical protein